MQPAAGAVAIFAFQVNFAPAAIAESVLVRAWHLEPPADIRQLQAYVFAAQDRAVRNPALITSQAPRGEGGSLCGDSKDAFCLAVLQQFYNLSWHV